jgi:2-oxoglutarate/2-oxoacid ferredoxin oxidoreductase subunit alpha
VLRYPRVLVPEMNMGQLRLLLRAAFLVDAQGYNKVAGLPFTTSELQQAIIEHIEQPLTPNGARGTGASS